MAEKNSERNPVELLAEEFLARCRGGEQPELAEYIQRLPAHAEEIRELFPMLQRLEQVADSDDAATPRMGTERLKQVGDYRIIREIGRGGMGIVYEAMQQSLGRSVALKVLPSHNKPDELALARFRREARAAAQLHHTNIVPVFEVGHEATTSYYAMQFIEGQSFDKVIEELRYQLNTGNGLKAPVLSPLSATSLRGSLTTPSVKRPADTTKLITRVERTSTVAPVDGQTDSAVDKHGMVVVKSIAEGSTAESEFREYFRSVAVVGNQVSQALGYAHARGVVHRDIKPSNLLLDRNGVVWVTDFGMAKMDAEPLTRTGEILGTIHYMAPERFQGQCDQRADIYAVGLSVYELLTLSPAFEATDRLRLMDLIAKQEPPRPRTLNPQVPRDLETIVLKAIEKDPRSRYQSADEMADDFERFLEDRPIRARKAGVAERFVRWTRRNPLLSGLSVTIVLVLLLVTVGATITAMFLKSSNNRAVKAEKTAQGRADELLRQSYVNWVNLAYLECRNDNVARAKEYLEKCLPHQRGWEWQFVASQCQTPLRSMSETGHSVNCIDFRPDGKWIAIGTGNFLNRRGPPGDLVVRDVWTGEAKFTKQGLDNGVTAVAFSPDGKRIASANGRSLNVWDAETGAQLFSKEGTSDDLLCLAFSADGSIIAGGFGRFNSSRVGHVQCWDAATGAVYGERLPGHRGGVWDVAFAPSGKRLAMTSENQIEIWDVGARESVTKLVANTGFIYCVAYHPEGRYVAAAGLDRAIRLWDVETGELVRTYTGHTGFVRDLAFSRDGRRIISAGEDKSVRLWNVGSESEIATFHGHTHFVNCVSFSGNGLIVASGSLDQSVKVWFATSEPQLTYKGHVGEGHVRGLAFGPHGGTIASGSFRFSGPTGRLHLWDPQTGRRLLEFPHVEEVSSVAFSKEGGQLAAAHINGSVTVWNAQTAELLHRLDAHVGEVSSVAFSPDGSRLASVGEDAALLLWDAGTGSLVRASMGHQDYITSVEFSPDGGAVATASEDGTVRLWEAATGRELRVIRHPGGEARRAVFSPDGTRLVSTGGVDHRRGDVLVWDMRNGQQIMNLPGHTDIVYDVDFNSDGTRFATASDDRTIKIWDPHDGREVFTIRGHTGGVVSVEFSPDDKLIASGSVDRSVRVWSATPTPADTYFRREAVSAYAQGQRMLAERRWNEAISGFDRAAELGLDGTDLHIDLATAFSKRTTTAAKVDQTDVLERIDQAVADTPDDGRELVQLGLELSRHGYLTQAAEAIRRASKSAPNDLAVLSAAGRVHGTLRQLDRARRDFERAVEQQKESARSSDWWWETDWWHVGPFSSELTKARFPDHIASPVEELFSDTDAAPDRGEVTWRALPSDGDGYLDFQGLGSEREQVSYYATQHVYSPVVQSVAFLVSADDGMRVWVNRELVFEQDHGSSQIRAGQRAILGSLRAGWNTVLVELTDRQGPNGFYFQLSNHARDLARGAAGKAETDRVLEIWRTASASEKDDVRLLRIVADTYARKGRWDEAADVFERLIERQPARNLNWVSLAPLLIQTGRIERYRSYRHDLLKNFGNARNPITAERTSKASLLIPVSDAEAVLPDQLASESVDAGANHSLAPYFFYAKGLSAYRLGDYETAIRMLEESLEGNRARWPYLDAIIHLFLAMSHQRLDAHDDALRHFRTADRVFTEHLPDTDTDSFGAAWLDWLICQIAKREAQQLFSTNVN